MYSASAFASNTIIRSAVAVAFPLFTVQMFTKVLRTLEFRLQGFVADLTIS